MTLYAVMGTVDCPGGADCHEYFYGVFSTKKKANRIIDDLKSKPWFGQDEEELSVEEITLNKPTGMYDVMMME